MKKVLIICGSPRKGGNSDLLAAQLEKGAREAGCEVESVYLRDLRLNYCLGCMACQPSRKACVQKDAANDIMPKMMAADVIVLATPVYYYSITGQMKVFLDRMNPLYGHLRNKELVYIVTAADSSHAQLSRAMDALQGWADCFSGMTVRARIFGGGATDKGDIEGQAAYQEAYEVGRNI